MIDGIWQPLEVPDFASNPNYKFIEPAFNADGTELFFMSTRPRDSSANPMDEDIWKVEKIDGIWTNVQNIGYPVCTDKSEYFPSLTHDGTLYFTRHEKDEGADVIYRSRLLNGKYQEPERLPKQINCGADRFNAFVSPDESYVIVPAVGVEPGIRTVQYYITFHNADDTWTEPVNMGPEINLPRGNGWSMNLSPDGKYLFFMSSRSDENSAIPAKLSSRFFHALAQQAGNGSADIYWINASVIEQLTKR